MAVLGFHATGGCLVGGSGTGTKGGIGGGGGAKMELIAGNRAVYTGPVYILQNDVPRPTQASPTSKDCHHDCPPVFQNARGCCPEIKPVQMKAAGGAMGDADPSALSFWFRAIRRAPTLSEAQVLKPGETLRTGERIAFVIETSAPAYVYLVQISGPSQRLDMLFPNPGMALANPLAASSPVKFPPKGWFALDDQDLGLEHVYILVSRRELKELRAALDRMHAASSRQEAQAAGARVVQVVAAASTDPRCQVPGGAEAPAGCGTLTRGLILAAGDDDDGGSQSGDATPVTLHAATAPGDDTIVTEFSFRHDP